MQWTSVLQIKCGGAANQVRQRCKSRAVVSTVAAMTMWTLLQAVSCYKDQAAMLPSARHGVEVLPLARGGATIGEWRCYYHRVAVLLSASGGATVGTRQCYLGRAAVLQSQGQDATGGAADAD
jgi:hypothetical protein